MTYTQPLATPVDPTSVVGRRVVAFLIDVFVPLVVAAVAGALMWFGAATKITNAGDDFCNRFRSGSLTISDAVYDAFPNRNSPCAQLNDEAFLASSDDSAGPALVFLGLSGLIALNVFVLQGVTGASAGKHLMGLRVVKGDGSIAGFGSNALRSLMLLIATVLSFCLLIGWIVELIVASASKRHQRIGDMAASTYVVRKADVGSPVAMAAMAPQQWGAPTQTWGQPTPTWGDPAPTTGQPPTWGSSPTPTPTPTPASGSWGAPTTPVPTEPTVTAPALDPTDAGWASPTPAGDPLATNPLPTEPASFATPSAITPEASAPESGPAQQPAPAMQLPPGAEMRWDDRWNAWLYWDPSAQRWLRHDPATNQWLPM